MIFVNICTIYQSRIGRDSDVICGRCVTSENTSQSISDGDYDKLMTRRNVEVNKQLWLEEAASVLITTTSSSTQDVSHKEKTSAR